MDANNNNVSCSGEPAVTNVYYIQLLKLINDVSFDTTILTKFNSAAILTAVLPGETGGIKSSPPLSGKLIVKCVDENNQMSKSTEIPVNYNQYWIAYKAMESCFGLYNKIEGLECPQDDGWQRYYQNGICIRIRFKGINHKMGQFEFLPGDVTPLGGDNLKFDAKVVKHYGGSDDPSVTGTNLFYSPIPFEMLRTYEEKP